MRPRCEDDPQLLGLIFAIPYQVLEPDFAFVIDGPGRRIAATCWARWTRKPSMRGWQRNGIRACRSEVADPGPDRPRWRGSDWARHLIHHPDFGFPAALAAYPSHGHIDLLPEARGKGIGRRAMALLEQRLAAAGSTGLFMQLDLRNEDALRFYEAVGFEMLRDADLPADSVYVAKRL